MTKADLIREISQQTGIERAIVAQVIEGVMEGIKSSLIGGEEVFLRGFGSFILKKRAAKTALPEHDDHCTGAHDSRVQTQQGLC